MKTLFQATSHVLERLDDPLGIEYPRTLVNQLIQDGYDQLLRKVEGLFDIHFPELVVGTQTYSLPDETVKVDRVTFDWSTLDPQYRASMRNLAQDFQSTSYEPSRYVIDGDGLNTIRLIGAPVEAMTTYTVSGTRGVLKQITSTEFASEAVSGTRGILRQTAAHVWIGSQWGHPKRLFSDDNSVRIEYFRLGKRLEENDGFEIPDRFVKVVEFWAMAKCLERTGPGQDINLSKHYRSRFDSGVERFRARINTVHKERVGKLGGRGISTRLPVARLDPNHFPRGA